MLTIAITAWPKTKERLDCLLRTIESLEQLETMPDRMILSCETPGVPMETMVKLYGLGYEVRWREREPNLGTHLDELFSSIRGYVLYVQDDTPLLNRLNLSAGLDLLAGNTVKMVRYWHEYSRMKDVPAFTNLSSAFKMVPNDCMDVYSDRPFLADASFATEHGGYGDGGKTGRGHEDRMNSQFKKYKTPVAASYSSCFGHIGNHSVFVPGKVWGIE